MHGLMCPDQWFLYIRIYRKQGSEIGEDPENGERDQGNRGNSRKRGSEIRIRDAQYPENREAGPAREADLNLTGS